VARYAAADNLRPQHAANGWLGANPNGPDEKRGTKRGTGVRFLRELTGA